MHAILAILVSLVQPPAEDRPDLLIVVGAEGNPDYGAMFLAWADQWAKAGEDGAARVHRVGSEPATDTEDRERLRAVLHAQSTGPKSAPLWVVLIGHGTYDGRTARFNLRGPDVTAQEFAEWLAPVERPVAVINCASASGPFLNALSGPDRVIVTATRSGDELNFARFGRYIAEAIGTTEADLDKDGQVSLLEAFLMASNRTAEFYKSEARLATEHALIDDTGDQLGTPPDWFRGVRAVRSAKEGVPVDGVFAHQWHLVPSEKERAIPAEVRKRRDELERSVAELRAKKAGMGEDEYYAELEKLMVGLARLYQPTDPKAD